MFSKKEIKLCGVDAIAVELPFPYDLRSTMECGQCFRYQPIPAEAMTSPELISEYIIPVGNAIARVGQRRYGELLFFGATDDELEGSFRSFFALDTDFGEIKRDILSRTDSEWLARAADASEGIAILKQDEWEAIFSFIVSQNNNIPRIRKIISQLAAAYGSNLAEGRFDSCPLARCEGKPCKEVCLGCGACYSFPEASSVAAEPEKMLPAKTGFRYKYLLDAAEAVSGGRVNLSVIAAARSYTHTVECLKAIKGVGDKVASCAALFGFGNLEAFPIDVWMKRAIDTYFDGRLDPASLGRYAGVAQQYIFNYIRNIEGSES